MNRIARAVAITAMLLPGLAVASPALMSAEWAQSACAAWNQEARLTDELKESGWSANNKGRGFKVMQIFSNECKDAPRVEMRIAEQDGKAKCVYGGKAETDKLDSSADYVMHADTSRWVEMGKGEYGPMRAMMFGRLQFEGPKGEAMKNMGPFGSFLLLVGKVPGDVQGCPE